MPSEDAPHLKVPLVSGPGPRVALCAQASTESEKTIHCRRVVTLLGSRAGCKVELRSKRVSAVHAAIVYAGSDAYVVDLLTRRGTLLNGLKLVNERLSDADRLAIGPWEFHVRLNEPAPVDDADVHTMDLEPTPQVIAFEHVNTKRILKPHRDVCIIGRRAGCDITVEDNTVSRTHALLFTYHGYPTLFDLLSCNGTFVNDARIGFRVLHDQDIVTIGEARFRVRLVGPGSTGLAKQRDEEKTEPAEPEESMDDSPPDLLSIEEAEEAIPWKIADRLSNTTPNK